MVTQYSEETTEKIKYQCQVQHDIKKKKKKKFFFAKLNLIYSNYEIYCYFKLI